MADGCWNMEDMVTFGSDLEYNPHLGYGLISNHQIVRGVVGCILL